MQCSPNSRMRKGNLICESLLRITKRNPELPAESKVLDLYSDPAHGLAATTKGNLTVVGCGRGTNYEPSGCGFNGS
jgi:hypothetical protein